MSLSDQDILTRTILREAGELGKETYESIAWIIYNRLKHNGEFGKTPKEVCLKIGQFEVWSPFWGIENIPAEDVDPDIKTHQGYENCSMLADRILRGQEPTDNDLTKGALHCLSMSGDEPHKRHPNGVEINRHWFFRT